MAFNFSSKAAGIQIYLKKAITRNLISGYSFSKNELTSINKLQESMFPKQLLCLVLPIHH